MLQIKCIIFGANGSCPISEWLTAYFYHYSITLCFDQILVCTRIFKLEYCCFFHFSGNEFKLPIYHRAIVV